MKHFLTISFLLFLCLNLAEAQQIPTFADPPGPEHVLVVYKTPSNGNDTLGLVSEAVKDYYQLKRGIPNSNIVELTELDTLIDITHNGVTHTIYLDQQGEIIRDMNNKDIPTPSIHSWIYFNEKIAKKIAFHLQNTFVNGTPLKDIIRFVVLAKGVPFRIDAREEDADSDGQNVICANLLTRPGETMEDEDALPKYFMRMYHFVEG